MPNWPDMDTAMAAQLINAFAKEQLGGILKSLEGKSEVEKLKVLQSRVLEVLKAFEASGAANNPMSLSVMQAVGKINWLAIIREWENGSYFNDEG